MFPSSRKLYLDYFHYFGSSLAHLEPELELFEVWEINVQQIIIIANGINFKQPKLQTALAQDHGNGLKPIRGSWGDYKGGSLTHLGSFLFI